MTPWSLLCGIFSPDFLSLLGEVLAQYKKSKQQQTSVALDQAFDRAEKEKNTEDLALEVGRLIK